MTIPELIPTKVYPTAAAASVAVAREIADLIRARAAAKKRCVLGLATGSSPMTVYAELVRLHKEEGLSFKNVETFNLDEYYPLEPDALQSYHRFMREYLFDHVDIPAKNIHIPDGMLPVDAVPAFVKQYEQAIKDAGGIDLQLLGIGRTGHIGFNESGSGTTSRTRLIVLDKVTRLDAAGDFFGAERVPRRALTMGVGTILESRRVILLAFGEHKAAVIARAIELATPEHAKITVLAIARVYGTSLGFPNPGLQPNRIDMASSEWTCKWSGSRGAWGCRGRRVLT